jgi:hypothetical protein
MKGLGRDARLSLTKARESALLAVEVYNKPAVTFKAGGYVTLMVIAWTALFHAIFYRRRTKPYYKLPNGRYQRIGTDYRHWELQECLRAYYGADTENAVRKNLEFFIPLRNKIEHRSMPEIDSSIFGECQSMLLNFDEMIAREFGAKNCLRESLSFALQFYPSARNLVEAVKKNASVQNVAEFVTQYRSCLSTKVLEDSKYAFKAFLIQVANHKTADTLPIQFVQYEQLSAEQKEQVGRFGALVKYTQPGIANEHTMSASEVVRRVQAALGDPKIKRGAKEISRYSLDWHTRCWKLFDARPASDSKAPDKTNTKYCVYDKRHKDYGYTEAWVAHLTKYFKDGKAYDTLYPLQSNSD